MTTIPVKTVCTAVCGEVCGNPDSAISGVSTDTRRLAQGDVFFALSAQRDGHEFVRQAFKLGAAAAVVSRPVAVPAGKTAILVKDTLTALGDFARWYRLNMQAEVVGITGSNGKTTTKEMLGCILSGAAPTVKSKDSFNNAIGVPHTLFCIEPADRYAVVEIGTNHHGEIRRLADIARPVVGIVTNISATHLEGLGTIKGVAEEKAALVEALPSGGVAVLNADDFRCRSFADRTAARVVTFGLKEKADIRGTNVRASGHTTYFTALGLEFSLPAAGRHNVSNALAAIAAATALGVGPELIRERLAALHMPPMRMQMMQVGGITVCNDAYNANFESMLAALVEYSQMLSPGRKVVVCGDMLEMGDRSVAVHQEIGRRIAQGKFDLLVAIGGESMHTATAAAAGGMPENRITHCMTTVEAGKLLPRLLERRDTLLLKASRRIALDSLLGPLADWQAAGLPADAATVDGIYHTSRTPATIEGVRA